MWLLESNTFRELRAAYERGAPEANTAARAEISATSGREAHINIEGVLTKTPNIYAALMGGGNTTYKDIIDALSAADSDENTDTIVLNIDSPGGQLDGMFDAIAALQATKKPIEARVSNLCASAAYALASQAGSIVATSPAARIGSIGVVVTMYTDDSEVDITSTNAPNKRPDVRTEEGRAVVREELDALHDLFVDAIAAGRGTHAKNINENFGRGATLLAGEALKRGMVDNMQKLELNSNKIHLINAEIAMDLITLRAQHPDIYAEAIALGVSQERDRVSAHLTMGEASGDTKTAFGAIKDGSEMTANLQATYMAAGMNKRDIDARQADTDSAAAGGKLSDEDNKDATAGASLLASAAELCGVELGGAH